MRMKLNTTDMVDDSTEAKKCQSYGPREIDSFLVKPSKMYVCVRYSKCSRVLSQEILS